MVLLEQFINGNGVLALVLAVLLLESLVMLWRRPQPARRPTANAQLWSSLSNLGAGACLVLAMLARSNGAPWAWVAASLTLAFALHVIDLYVRWRP